MKIFSCCKSSTIVEVGATNQLKPEASFWKLVCSQRLQQFFDDSNLPFPSYLKTTIQKVTELLEGHSLMQEQAVSLQKEFQSQIQKLQRTQKSQKGILGSYNDQDQIYSQKVTRPGFNYEYFVEENLTASALSVYELIQIQIQNEQHPIFQINNIFSKAFVSNYSKYTGIGSKTKLSREEKKGMFKKLIEDSKALRDTLASENSNRTEINSSVINEDFELIDDENKVRSVSALATDELYIVLKTICLMVETFYKHLLPTTPDYASVIQMLHEDIFKLCQQLMFNDESLYSTVLILVRVDTQLDDKDIRHKCKQLSSFTTQEFGLNEYVQLSYQQKQTQINRGLDNIQEVDEDDINDTIRQTKHLEETEGSFVSLGTELFLDCQEEHKEAEEFKVKNLLSEIKEINLQSSGPPYQKSIIKLKNCLRSKTLSPIEKLIQIKEVISLLKSEIREYWEMMNQSDEFQIELDRSDVLSILIFVVAKAQIEDLRAQFAIIQAFTSNQIQNGFSLLSAAFSDFQNAVNFIGFIDKNQVQLEGSNYLQTVSMDKLKTMMYEYPDSSDTGSLLTSYDMFAVGVQSRGDLSMSNNNQSFASFRQQNRISTRPNEQKLREAKRSMISKDRKIVIEINGIEQKKRAMSRINISKGSNFNTLNKSGDAKSFQNSSFELM